MSVRRNEAGVLEVGVQLKTQSRCFSCCGGTRGSLRLDRLQPSAHRSRPSRSGIPPAISRTTGRPLGG